MQLDGVGDLTGGSERRRCLRIVPEFETVVYNGEIFGKLLDISREGLAFSYDTEFTRINDKFFELNLLGGQKKLYIPNLFCKSVFDVPLQDDLEYRSIRRRSVRFSALTPHQQVQLNDFVAG